MTYQSVHTGPEVDAAVSVLNDVQDIRTEVAADKATVTTLAGQTATNAGLAQTAATNAQADAASALASKNDAHTSAQTAGAHAANADSARALAVVARNGAEQAQDSAWEAEGEVRYLLGESEATIDSIRAEILRQKYGAGPYPSLDIGMVGANVLDRRVTFTRASDATYWDSLGTLQTAGPNEPRFDYDPVTGESLGLLVEGQATNRILHSDFQVTQTVTVTSAAMTLSFWGTGSVTLSGAYSGSLVGTSNSDRVWLTFTPAEAGALMLTISGNVERAQLETGTSPTSYIKTEASQVTRARDEASLATADFPFSPSEGTFIVDVELRDVVGASNYILQAANSSSALRTTNSLLIWRNLGVIRFSVFDPSGGVVHVVSTLPGHGRLRIAASYDEGAQRIAMAVNGTLYSSTLSEFPVHESLQHISMSTNAGGDQTRLFHQINYYPRALSDAQLVEMTSP